MNGVIAALIVELGLITYRGGGTDTAKQNPISKIPVPAEYAGAFIVFGALSFANGRAAPAANVFAWGLVIATALNLFPETGPKVNLPGLTFISPSNPTGTTVKL